MDINTCFETTKDYHVVALYSHLIPAAIAVFLSVFILNKSNSLLVKLFALFTASFALWLLGDVVLWTATDYNLVSFLWAPLDYINVLFYLLGAYFLVVLVRGRDVPLVGKILTIALALPAWWITVTGHSITEFDQTVCEALNNEFLTNYKFFIEFIVMAFIMFYALFTARKRAGIERKKIVTVALALILFFATFSVTEYISSTTGVYEINLYSLFVLPVFLFMIVYAISDLEVFNVRMLGFQILPYVLVIMIGSQFFFLEDSTFQFMTIITFILSLGFAWLFLRSGKRELEAHNKVEALAHDLEQANVRLREADEAKNQTIDVVGHQMKTVYTRFKWYCEMLRDGSATKEECAEQVEAGNAELVSIAQMFLDAAHIHSKDFTITLAPADLNVFFKRLSDGTSLGASKSKIKYTASVPHNLPKVLLDETRTFFAVENLLSNALKYTHEGGSVDFTVTVANDTLHVSVKDTGVGIPKQDHDKMFGQMYRASNVRKTVEGNGLGLYIAKYSIEKQGGKIWFESEGVPGKGTAFFIDLPLKSVPDEKPKDKK
jgi:signal transduction histidine kinase